MMYYWVEDQDVWFEVGTANVQEAAALVLCYCKGMVHLKDTEPPKCAPISRPPKDVQLIHLP